MLLKFLLVISHEISHHTDQRYRAESLDQNGERSHIWSQEFTLYPSCYTDLIFFHKIFYNKLCITLPSYLSLVIPTPDQYRSRLRNRIVITPNNVHPIFQCTLNTISQDPNDPLLLKCNMKPRTQVNDNTFFIRTYNEWNKLPLLIRIEESPNLFETKLKNYIWELLREKLGRELWPDWDGVLVWLLPLCDCMSFIVNYRMVYYIDVVCII